MLKSRQQAYGKGQTAVAESNHETNQGAEARSPQIGLMDAYRSSSAPRGAENGH